MEMTEILLIRDYFNFSLIMLVVCRIICAYINSLQVQTVILYARLGIAEQVASLVTMEL
jgi:hypothetical protein